MVDQVVVISPFLDLRVDPIYLVGIEDIGFAVARRPKHPFPIFISTDQRLESRYRRQDIGTFAHLRRAVQDNLLDERVIYFDVCQAHRIRALFQAERNADGGLHIFG